MPKNMRGKYERLLAPFSVIFLIPTACGYSQDAWDQKVRRNGELREELAAEQRDRAQAENDYADALEELERISQMRMEPLAPKAQEKKLEAKDASACLGGHLLLPQQAKIESLLAQETKIAWSLKESFPSVTLSLPLSQVFQAGTTQVNEATESFIIRFLKALVVPQNVYELTYRITPAAMHEEATSGQLKTEELKSEATLEHAEGDLSKQALDEEQVTTLCNLMLARALKNINQGNLKLSVSSEFEIPDSSRILGSRFELRVALKSNKKPALNDASEQQDHEQSSEIQTPQP